MESLVPERIWHAQSPVAVGPLKLTTRMTVVRLYSGDLWVHSLISPGQALIEQLSVLGEVRYVVAPNCQHHRFFRSFLQAFPVANGFIAPGLAAKRPDLSDFETLDSSRASDWAPELEAIFIAGLPTLNETVWFHPATGTLILTDLLFCFGRGQPALKVQRIVLAHDQVIERHAGARLSRAFSGTRAR